MHLLHILHAIFRAIIKLMFIEFNLCTRHSAHVLGIFFFLNRAGDWSHCLLRQVPYYWATSPVLCTHISHLIFNSRFSCHLLCSFHRMRILETYTERGDWASRLITCLNLRRLEPKWSDAWASLNCFALWL